MRLRVEGTPTEVEATVEVLRTVLDVQEVSRFYPNRGASTLGRVYVTAAAPQAKTSVRARATRLDEVGGRAVRRRKPAAELENDFIDLDNLDEGERP